MKNNSLLMETLYTTEVENVFQSTQRMIRNILLLLSSVIETVSNLQNEVGNVN